MMRRKGYRDSVNDGGISVEYMRKHYLSADGIAHVRPMGEKPAASSKGRRFDYSDDDIENIKKCLSCKRKDCTGGAACFRKGAKT